MNNITLETWGRSQWPVILQSLDANEVIETVEIFARDYRVEDVALPQSGLGLLQMQDGAMGERYYLGEIPVSVAQVQVLGNDGYLAQGATRIMNDNLALARAIAIADAALSAKLEGHGAILPLIEKGALVLAQQASSRRRMLAATVVDFSLLGSAEEDEDE